MDLDEDTSKTTLTLDAYYQDEGQAQGGLNGVYSSLRDYFRKSLFLNGNEQILPFMETVFRTIITTLQTNILSIIGVLVTVLFTLMLIYF